MKPSQNTKTPAGIATAEDPERMLFEEAEALPAESEVF
jgi:hypothetical protein